MSSEEEGFCRYKARSSASVNLYSATDINEATQFTLAEDLAQNSQQQTGRVNYFLFVIPKSLVKKHL